MALSAAADWLSLRSPLPEHANPITKKIIMSDPSLKLTGYDFYRKIGSPTKIVAPMVDHSELSFRMLTRRYGAQLVYTQMFNANCFVTSDEGRLFTTCPEDRPLIVQFCGHDPQVLLQAARMVEDKCDAVDINLGCPQGIAKRGRYGAYLMEELPLLHDIVSTLAKGLKIPVTCKSRIYKDYDATIRLYETLVSAGASMITVHGRTRDEKGQAVAAADWGMIRRIKEHFGDRVPIIANGGIECYDDIDRCLQATGADGVMSSEAILENAALFYRNPDSTAPPIPMVDLAEQFLSLSKQYPGPCKCARNHLMKFFYRYFAKHVELRDEAATSMCWEDFDRLVSRVREVVGGREEDFASYSWYHRYRSSANIGAPESGGALIDSRGKGLSKQQRRIDALSDKLWDALPDDDEGGIFSFFVSAE